ncbi:cytochrome c oxidase subunit 3 family protein [Rhodococcus sp. WS4]|nr:cytochrome c oxidase subunit 3 family protein [Rhodococcus sp. WS4]
MTSDRVASRRSEMPRRSEAVSTADRPTKPRRLPGVDGVWVFIGADSAIFAILFMSFMKDRLTAPGLFEASSATLNYNLGGLDTLILLTSSWLVALAVQAAKRGELARSPRFLLGGVLTGCAFVVSKSTEYSEKFVAGITPATDAFYMWYFTLTGMHLVHVLVGIGLLTYLWIKGRRKKVNIKETECVASYWHLVDLLWIVLFPLLYLLPG